MNLNCSSEEMLTEKKKFHKKIHVYVYMTTSNEYKSHIEREYNKFTGFMDNDFLE